MAYRYFETFMKICKSIYFLQGSIKSYNKIRSQFLNNLMSTRKSLVKWEYFDKAWNSENVSMIFGWNLENPISECPKIKFIFRVLFVCFYYFLMKNQFLQRFYNWGQKKLPSSVKKVTHKIPSNIKCVTESPWICSIDQR